MTVPEIDVLPVEQEKKQERAKKTVFDAPLLWPSPKRQRTLLTKSTSISSISSASPEVLKSENPHTYNYKGNKTRYFDSDSSEVLHLMESCSSPNHHQIRESLAVTPLRFNNDSSDFSVTEILAMPSPSKEGGVTPQKKN